jgi:hypothetical protein
MNTPYNKQTVETGRICAGNVGPQTVPDGQNARSIGHT